MVEVRLLRSPFDLLACAEGKISMCVCVCVSGGGGGGGEVEGGSYRTMEIIIKSSLIWVCIISVSSLFSVELFSINYKCETFGLFEILKSPCSFY